MAAKLKVFTWSDGFHAYTVATTSRAKALAAWGVTRDLFRDGDAKDITEGADHAAALASPGETIKRGLSVDVGKIASVAKAKAPKAADVAKVAALERELASLQSDQDVATEALATRRAKLDQEEEALSRVHAERRDALEARLRTARKRLER